MEGTFQSASNVCKPSVDLGAWNSETAPCRPEYANLLRFAAAAAGAPLEQRVPQVCQQIKRLAGVAPNNLADYLVRSHNCTLMCVSKNFCHTHLAAATLQRPATGLRWW